MRTVIIAEKKHIDEIETYRLFLEPFLNGDVKFCEWNTEEQTVEKMIPQIIDCIGGERDWKAVLLFDEPNARENLNPFDVVKEEKSETEKKDAKSFNKKVEQLIEDLNKESEVRMEAYERAAQQPLTRLVTFLCAAPLDSNEQLVVPEIEKPDEEMKQQETEQDKADRRLQELNARKQAECFNAYKAVANHKKELRAQIIDKKPLTAEQPKEVYCVSLRSITDARVTDAKRLELAWNSHNSVQYSDFGDRNMYFEHMRYFVYDILPDNHVNYKFNYLEFLYTLLVFAANKVPSNAVQPNRLYCLNSDCSEDRLRKLILSYDQKLENTVNLIKKKQEEIKSQIPGPLTDDEAEKLFQTKQVIPVTLSKDLDLEGYYAKDNVFGLSKDCPKDEDTVWNEMYRNSNTAMHKLMKQPRRSLEKGVECLRRNNMNKNLKSLGLNHFQVEDIQEFTETQEDEMVSVPTKDLYDIDRYEKEMEEGNREVKRYIETRMTKKTTLILGITALVLFFIGFIPVLFFNREILNAALPLIMTAVAVGILGIIGLIALFYFRQQLKDRIFGYNHVMGGIHSDVTESMTLFSRYLTHAGCVMRGNSVLEECRKKDNAFKEKLRILGGHIEKIQEKQTGLRKLFGNYVGVHPVPDSGDVFIHDYEKVAEYDFPIAFDEGCERYINFMEDGNRIIVPYDVVEKITIRMEELYE